MKIIEHIAMIFRDAVLTLDSGGHGTAWMEQVTKSAVPAIAVSGVKSCGSVEGHARQHRALPRSPKTGEVAFRNNAIEWVSIPTRR